MKILDRLGLMMRADAHGMMDQLEERSLLVKQHLRDAEIALGHDRARLAALDEELRRLEESSQRADQRLVELDANVELALERDEPELARYAVRRLLPERAALRQMRERAAEIGAERDRLAVRLREQEAGFETLRARARAQLAELERAEREDVTSAGAFSDEDVELELLRRRGADAPSGSTTREVPV